MTRTKIQLDDVSGFHRLSLGEFCEEFPSTSQLVPALHLLMSELGCWRPERLVVVAHWKDDGATLGWRQISSFRHPRSLFRSEQINLSELPSSTELAKALSESWALPRLLLLVAPRHSEDALRQISDREWSKVLDDEIPAPLLALRLPLLILGFYHQAWISAYAPSPLGSLAEKLALALKDDVEFVQREL